MEYVTLGKTGLTISRLGFGGIPIQRVDAEVTKTLVKEMYSEWKKKTEPMNIFELKYISISNKKY